MSGERQGLPIGWREVEFSNLLREPLRNGHSARAAEDGKGIRTLTLTAVTYGDFSEVNTKVTSASPEKADGLWLEPGDVLIERSNTAELVGTARVYRGRRDYAIFPDLMIRARLVPEVSDKFIGYFLASEEARNYFRRSAQGIAGSMPKISQGTIERLRVPLAPEPEQDRIVAEIEKQFTRLDAGVEALKRLQVHLRRYRAAVLKAAFDRDWDRVALRTLLREPLRNGHSAPKATNGNGIRTLTLTAVTDGDFSEGNTKITSATSLKARDLWLEQRPV